MTRAPASGYVVFCDATYYDLWAARKKECKNFHETAHFETREDAIAWTHDTSLPLDERFN